MDLVQAYSDRWRHRRDNSVIVDTGCFGGGGGSGVALRRGRH